MAAAKNNRDHSKLYLFKVAAKGITALSLTIAGACFCFSVIYEGITGEKSSPLLGEFSANHKDMANTI